MIRNTEALRIWEDEQLRLRKPDFAESLRIVEALYEEARALGAFARTADLDERLARKIELARALNS